MRFATSFSFPRIERKLSPRRAKNIFRKIPNSAKNQIPRSRKFPRAAPREKIQKSKIRKIPNSAFAKIPRKTKIPKIRKFYFSQIFEKINFEKSENKTFSSVQENDRQFSFFSFMWRALDVALFSHFRVGLSLRLRRFFVEKVQKSFVPNFLLIPSCVCTFLSMIKEQLVLENEIALRIFRTIFAKHNSLRNRDFPTHK